MSEKGKPMVVGVLVGYARVSTFDQDLRLQRDALEAAGCEKIFSDVASGAKAERSGLAEALAYVRKGDTLVVWRLDRLGRSLQHLIETVRMLEAMGVGFRSLQENLDTTTSGGRLVFHIFGALAEFEREIIRERTEAGLAAARARGRSGGRPPGGDAQKVALAKMLRDNPSFTVEQCCEMLQVSRATFYRYTREQESEAPVASED